MAEAHSAVAFSFSISRDGVDFNVDYEALRAVWESGVRAYKKRIARVQNRFQNGIYPARPGSWMGVVMVVFTAAIWGFDLSFGCIHYLKSFCRRLFKIDSPHDHTMAAFMFSLFIWALGIFLMKYALMLLLSYKGWMYELRGRMSKKTKWWALLVKMFGGRKPGLYSYQGSLPKLPLPSIDDTLKRYLNSVRPLLDDAAYERMEKLAADFKHKHGRRFQFYLRLKHWWSPNYVSDWWEDYVYLHGRSPIMVNSNFYAIDAILVKPTSVQAARAANVVYGMLSYMREVEREELKPILLNGTVPLCSRQYERQFNTTRIPGIKKDRIVHYRDSHHLVVYHAGRYFKCYFHFDGKWLEPCELETMFQRILDDKTEPAPGEEKLAALTAGDRVPWAKARQQFFNRGLNKTSLDAIEKAAFVLVFDDEEHDYDPNDDTKLDSYARSLLHGRGYDRWFDKSFNLVVCRNGRIGFNAEHSWADAPIMAHLWETSLITDKFGFGPVIDVDDTSKRADAPIMAQMWEYTLFGQDIPMGYTPEGHCRGQPKGHVPNPIRLQWEISSECQTMISDSLAVVESLCNDVDLHLLVHNEFGKGLMKKCRMSPDAFIQLALQLTYFRDAGRFCLTYEASMTRLFREGRTETVRSCTVDSSAFVRAMVDSECTKQEKIRLLKVAADTHQLMYRDAMTGKGIDRHLFCLYVISKYLGVDSPFLAEVLGEPWRLSTSQTPYQQTDKLDLTKHPNFISAGGGFGPVADDGYGVSYIIAGEDCIFFHISCKNSCKTTSSRRFGDTLKRSLADMRALFQG